MNNFLELIKPQLKNPCFYSAVLSVIFLSGNIDIETLTTWSLLADALKSIVSSPYTLFLIVVNVMGIINNNSTDGFGE